MPHGSEIMEILLFLWRRRTSVGLAAALLIYAALAIFAVREQGLVGEIAIGELLAAPPRVLLQFDPPLFADGQPPVGAGDQAGPLIASQVRPIERIALGPLQLPLAINAYTGGPPDWLARLVYGITGAPGAVVALNLFIGALLIIGVHRLLRAHASDIAATLGALVLATDAGFLFYRKALGGTELLLCGACLLCLHGLWSRRWAGGRRALLLFGVGVGLGLLAKVTFILSLGALVLTALLTRWDKPALRPPLPQRWWLAALPVLLLTAPLWIAALHHSNAQLSPHIASHDFPGLQWSRVLRFLSGGPTPARESWTNLSYWAGDLYAFLGPAYGAVAPAAWSPWRGVAWVLLLAGCGLGWRRRAATSQEALLRFTTIYLLLQLGVLLLVARDLHHLATATPTLAIVAGLGLDRLAAVSTPARSFARARLGMLLCLPWLGTGLAASLGADAALRTVPVPTFTSSGQRALVGLIEGVGPRRLVLCDYESYGLLEILLADQNVEIENDWGAASRAGNGRDDALIALLGRARGDHLLIVKASAPMVYNLTPSRSRLAVAAERGGFKLEIVGALPGDGAVLYRVE